MPDTTPEPSQNKPWENGWAPDTSRTPGTRRLWLAGVLALATIVACVTAITVMDNETDDPVRASPSPSGSATVPGLISYATPSTDDATTPAGESDLSSTRTKASPAASPHESANRGSKPSKSPTPHASSPGHSKPSATYRSVRSVNYPDRYWHMSGDFVKLDPITSAPARRDATFKLVKGLWDASCYSFATSDGTYLRHRNFVLRSERSDGSSLFEQDATFCPKTSSYSGAVMLESVNYPGRFLRHQNFQLELDPYQQSDLYRADSAFRLVGPLA
ncbi:AbfB domain-containing protein [Streptomyces sp. NBC_00183]|uniref:AbfB domain-containing protein n=1 Tax=Streptomyces sp. NBC_00183 TaxID=2903633 RepID=UPI00225679BF|nr:AbfB domain-containing protein [Streptomyces sp. NBC_00183]MCX5289134.1 AbfB domain-containing protein [Streptomyces sp. NBC_00183]